jgi:hypothetical protein
MRINLEKILLGKKFTEVEQNPAIEEARNILKRSDDLEIEILERMGFTIQIIKIQENLSAMLDKKAVDIQDIRRVLLRYCLRMIPVKRYTGSICPLLGTRLLELESILKKPLERNRLFIITKSEYTEKDPVAVYQLDVPGKYYLVHKWGADLDVDRTNLLWNWFKQNNFTGFLLRCSKF